MKRPSAIADGFYFCRFVIFLLTNTLRGYIIWFVKTNTPKGYIK